MHSNSFFKIDSNLTCLSVTFVVLLLPLARGGSILWPQALSISVIGLLCVFLVIFNDFRELKEQKYWLLPWSVLTLFIIIQLIPFRAFDLAQSDPFMLRNRISVMPRETISYWALFTLYWIVAWLVANLSRERVIFIASAIGLLLLFESVYGIAAYIKDYQNILGVWYVESYSRVVSGTFVNRNHFVAVFEVATPLVLSLLLLPRVFGFKMNFSMKMTIGLLFLFICTLAVFNAYSRLGLICYLISLIIWLLLVLNRFGFNSSKKKMVLLMIGFFVFILFVGLWFGLEPLMTRFQNIGENIRYLLWGAALESFPTSYWLWGMGAGSLVDNFKVIAPIEIATKTVYQLHSDWLEFILDFGVFGSLIISSGFIFWFKKQCPKKLSVLQLGAISGVIAVAIHSFGDFSLQIPGSAVLFWVTTGILMNRKDEYSTKAKISMRN